MKFHLLAVALVAVLGFALAGAPTPLHAATADASDTMTAVKKTPYKGKLTAISASSLTVANDSTTLTLIIDAKTSIKKDKKPAKVTDFAVGDYVTGSYVTDASGKMVAHSLHEKTPKPAKN
jgi:hypothetical protein